MFHCEERRKNVCSGHTEQTFAHASLSLSRALAVCVSQNILHLCALPLKLVGISDHIKCQKYYVGIALTL